MQFIGTVNGYVNLMYVRRLYVDETKIQVEDVFGETHLYDDFESSESAQDWLDDMVKEIEDESRCGTSAN